ncbi:MAG: ergothioneine biosynthesis protein EgtB [Chloroflexi bacterium]|nr:ergothioneine biosynthesis protein EgtB [Chloroflexota bacterium]
MAEALTVAPEQIAAMLTQARATLLDLVDDLTDEQMFGPLLPVVNPPLWEIGHVAWFQEKWALRHLRRLPPARADGDALYDSAVVPHDARWELPLPSRQQMRASMQQILDSVIERLGPDRLADDEAYFHLLAILHEDMHAEAVASTRQTLGYGIPRFSPQVFAPAVPGRASGGGPLSGDVEVPGGIFTLGAATDTGYVFDNEKWAHLVEVRPFRIARAPVANAEFAAFVDDGGYLQERWWSGEGWRWREQSGAEHPAYWRREAPGRWLRRAFDTYAPLEPHLPVLHVCWYEAEAYCNWARRRLPLEAEWEMAASAEPDGSGGWAKRRFPWGKEPPTPERANLDWRGLGPVDVGAIPAGDSFFGCRQMIGNVWEWTATTFLPYPGFRIDPYKEYSEPWFRDHKVLRGGCWTTRGRLIRNTWRNFYTPDRRDVWAGFRTCALRS